MGVEGTPGVVKRRSRAAILSCILGGGVLLNVAVAGLLVWSGTGSPEQRLGLEKRRTPVVVDRGILLDTPVRAVMVTGDDVAVCREVIRIHEPEGVGAAAEVLAKGTADDGGRWLFCLAEPASGLGAFAARSTDGAHWKAQGLIIGQRIHEGSDVHITIDSPKAASLSQVGFATGLLHRVSTTDGGTTWLLFNWVG